MAFLVNINEFEGPLDLMLHLVKEKELDLFDLNIQILTDQYIQYIHQMESLHLEIASEYLSELAGLIEYKSKKLLPKDETVLESEYEEDPKDKLAQRLMEYQKFKEISIDLESLFLERQKLLSKPLSSEVEDWIKVDENQELEAESPYELVKVMTKILKRMALTQPLETKVTTKEISVDDRISQLKLMYGKNNETFSFEEILVDCKDMQLYIVSFLAVLDLIKTNEMLFTLDEDEMIWLKWSKTNE